MAGEIVTKKITELEENTTIDDADILMAGDKGTNALKRFTIGAFLTAIKAKLAAWTFDTLQTTSKTLPGAVNELNSKSMYFYNFWANGDETKNFVVKNTHKRPSFFIFGTLGGINFFEFYNVVNLTGKLTELQPSRIIPDVTGITVKINAHESDSGKLRIQISTPSKKGCQVYVMIPQSSCLITEW